MPDPQAMPCDQKQREVMEAIHAKEVPMLELEVWLCPIHESLDKIGKLKPLDNCVGCLRVERDELLTEVKQLRAQEWQPIATAPKDGVTFVLLWWEYWCSRPVIGRFNRARGFWDCTVSLSDEGAGPTHWRPLPDPPKEGQ